jgi:hypothetical protein
LKVDGVEETASKNQVTSPKRIWFFLGRVYDRFLAIFRFSVNSNRFLYTNMRGLEGEVSVLKREAVVAGN